MNIVGIGMFFKVINNKYLFITGNNNIRKNKENFFKSNQIDTEVKIGREK